MSAKNNVENAIGVNSPSLKKRRKTSKNSWKITKKRSNSSQTSTQVAILGSTLTMAVLKMTSRKEILVCLLYSKKLQMMPNSLMETSILETL